MHRKHIEMLDFGEHSKNAKPRRQLDIVPTRHGLALAAFAVTHHMLGFAPNSEQYFKVAVRMAKFMYKHMREEATGHLLLIFSTFTERDGKGFSSDYAYRIRELSIHGLLKLHLSERLPESVAQTEAIEDADSDDDQLCCEDVYSGDVKLVRGKD